MNKQSFISRLLTALLCFIFHRNYEKSSTRSTTLARKSNSRKSFYKPLKCRIKREKQREFLVEKTIPYKFKTDTIVFHIHGGSFKARLGDFYRIQSVFYSKLFGGCKVYSVDYRVYPDVEFPTPLEDVYNAYIGLLNEGKEPENIIIVGDSCGANMAAALCHKLKDNNMPLPNTLVLFSFWGDLSNSHSTYKENCYRDPFYGIPKKLTYEECEDKLKRITLYAVGKDLFNPYLSPCFGDFSNFPKTILVTGSADISQGDSFVAYDKLKNAGVEAHLLSYENMFHDFQFVKFLPESRHAFRLIKKIMNEPKSNS